MKMRLLLESQHSIIDTAVQMFVKQHRAAEIATANPPAAAGQEEQKTDKQQDSKAKKLKHTFGDKVTISDFLQKIG
jgi:hypothetical protein